jgi:Kef-type K+ transport system membrane component KefB
MRDFLYRRLLDFWLGLLVLGLAVLIAFAQDSDLFQRPLWYVAGELAVISAGICLVGWYVLFRSGTRRTRDIDENHSNKTSGKDGP